MVSAAEDWEMGTFRLAVSETGSGGQIIEPMIRKINLMR